MSYTEFTDYTNREIYLCFNCGRIHLSKGEAIGCDSENRKWIGRYLDLKPKEGDH